MPRGGFTSDNVNWTEGSGKTLATDEIAGVHYPRSKISIGADGSASDWTGDVTVSNTVTVDGSGVAQPVTDNSGSLTVDAPVGTPVFVRLSDGSSAISTLPVSLASVPSHAVTNAGTFAVQESGSALTALQLIDDVVHSGDAALSKYAVIGAVLDDVSTGTVTENQANSLRMSSRRALLVEGVASGTAVTVSATNLSTNIAQMNGVAVTMGNGVSGTGVQRVTLASDSTGNIATIGTSVTPGTGATNLGKAEDAAHSSGDVGVMALGVRASSPTERSAGPTDGDYEPFATNAVGAVWITPTPAVGGGASIYSNTALSNTKQAAVAAACCVTGYSWHNPNSAVSYLQVFDVASGSVTVGTTAPTYVIGIPANGTANIEYSLGIKHATALTVAATTTATGSTAPSSALVGFFTYK